MKKIALIFLVLCNCLICNSGNISKKLLISNSWRVVYPDFGQRQSHILTFSNDNTFIWKTIYLRSKYTYSNSYFYYFTDQKPSKFDRSKIAKSDSGRYLVFVHISDVDKKNCFFVCYEEVSQDKNIIEFRDEDGQMWILEKQ